MSWWTEISEFEIYVWHDEIGFAVFLYLDYKSIYWNMCDTNVRITGDKAVDGPANWEWM